VRFRSGENHVTTLCDFCPEETKVKKTRLNRLGWVLPLNAATLCPYCAHDQLRRKGQTLTAFRKDTNA
jgi:hypothetical protein